MSALALTGVCRRGGFALHAELRAEPGEIVGVLGPNGAGKTTLLRVLAGLSPLSEGTLRLGDEVLDDPGAGVFRPPEARHTGVVFQDHRLFPHLDVLDNVAFGPRARGTGRSAARTLAADWLELLGLADLAQRRPAALSGGQAQRVALARALATEPGMLLLDEPLAAVDTPARLTLRAELRRHAGTLGAPVVLVTHDPLEALVVPDRLVVLEGGRVVQEGSAALVARRPATGYVARLVGLNLWAGRLDATGTVALDGGGTVVVPAGAAPPGPVLVSLRPSAVTVHTERPAQASTRNVWPGRVAALDQLGDRVRVTVDAAPPTLADVTPAAVAELGLAPGAPVWLSAKATEAEVYPAPPPSS